jgi:aspartate/methionine/tyrosine aminotransferase
VRENIRTFLEKRDGYSTDLENLFLTNGASEGISLIMRSFSKNPNDGIFIPIP